MSAASVLEKIQSGKIRMIELNKPSLYKEELEGVLDCLIENQIHTGAIVERFEKEFKSTFSRKHAITVNSPSSAYHLALMALEISPGDKVCLSTFAPHAALDAILIVGAIPVPVDLGKNSFHPDPDKMAEAITEHQPKAIILDHTFGCIFNIKNYSIGDIPVIEDFSEAIGADLEPVSVGRQGMLSICGLTPSSIITTGNGAIISTDNDIFGRKIRSYKLSQNNKREPGQPKYDYNMIDYEAAMGIEQLSKLGILIERKKKIANHYLQAVLSSGMETWFQKASEDQFCRFPLIVPRAFEEVTHYFQSMHIETGKTSEAPIHHIMRLSNTDFPNGERLFSRGHLIPIYPNLTKEQITRIGQAIRCLY